MAEIELDYKCICKIARKLSKEGFPFVTEGRLKRIIKKLNEKDAKICTRKTRQEA